MSFIYMKILEKTPKYYDRMIEFFSFTNLDKFYSSLTTYLKETYSVLDIGCGTGKLTLLVAEKSAYVKGIDVNPAMLDIAQKKAREKGLEEKVIFEEKSVVELDEEKDSSYDAVISALCFSELSFNELKYAMKHTKRILRPGGLALFIYESKPSNPLKLFFYFLIRLPLLLLTFIFVQKITRGLSKKEEKIIIDQFEIVTQKENWLGSIKQLVLRKSD